MPNVSSIESEIAAVAAEIERMYRSAPNRPDFLTQIARAVGGALTRVDGRPRQLDLAPEFVAPYDENEPAEP